MGSPLDDVGAEAMSTDARAVLLAIEQSFLDHYGTDWREVADPFVRAVAMALVRWESGGRA